MAQVAGGAGPGPQPVGCQTSGLHLYTTPYETFCPLFAASPYTNVFNPFCKIVVLLESP